MSFLWSPRFWRPAGISMALFSSFSSMSCNVFGPFNQTCSLRLPLTTKKKCSPIFVKFSGLIPRGALSSEPLEFLRYLYPFQRYLKFSFFDFSNSACLFEKIFLRKLQCLKYFLCWIQNRWNFYDISYRLKDINENIYIFLTVRDHSARLFWLKFDFYMYKIL